MRELISTVQRWLADGLDVAVATVVRVAGSAPRPAGAKMIVASDGQMAGSVSGGCVEPAVYQELTDILAGGAPRTGRYGISDEMGWDVGLACGGTLDVYMQPLAPDLVVALAGCLDRGEPCAAVIDLGGPDGMGHSALVALNRVLVGAPGPKVEAVAREALAGKVEKAQIYLTEGGAQIFVESYLPPPVLILIGGVHVAIPLSRFARALGFRVVVADPRGKFADGARFPEAHQVLVEWPEQALDQVGVDESTYVAILTHDPKIDEPALAAVLKTGAAYIGAIGSRKTHAERFARMARWGVDEALLGRVHAPIGLDLGGRTPEEMALSIMAEIIAVRNGRRGGSLRDRDTGRIGS